MQHYKLTYFDIMGLAEPIRLMFAQAGVEYENVMIPDEDDDPTWEKLKPTTPHCQLPILEVDGKVLAQSVAISNYLAKKLGFDGQNEWESAKAQELVQAINDVRQQVRAWRKEEDEKKKAEILKKLEHDVVTPYFDRHEKFLAKNGSGYFVGSHVTQADLHIFNTLQWWQNNHLFTEAFKNHPKIGEFVEKIANLPNIKKWIEKRPKTAV
uniref:Glutathione S-transferase n=1 Tax=Plectus sambesii TaxID=2011161 RepID=A0A914XF13_9BILA